MCVCVCHYILFVAVGSTSSIMHIILKVVNILIIDRNITVYIV